MIKELLLIACIDSNHIVDSNKMVYQDSVIKFQQGLITEQRYALEKRDALFGIWQRAKEREDSLRDVNAVRVIATINERSESEFRKTLTISWLGLLGITILTLILK